MQYLCAACHSLCEKQLGGRAQLVSRLHLHPLLSLEVQRFTQSRLRDVTRNIYCCSAQHRGGRSL